MGFEVFLKLPVIIIFRFYENNVLWPIYINIYRIWRFVDMITAVSFYFSLTIHKKGNITGT